MNTHATPQSAPEPESATDSYLSAKYAILYDTTVTVVSARDGAPSERVKRLVLEDKRANALYQPDFRLRTNGVFEYLSPATEPAGHNYCPSSATMGDMLNLPKM